MAGNSKIEWTEQTWNVIVGCSIVSPGCTNCYAMRQAPRTDALSVGCPVAGAFSPKLTKSTKAGPVWTGQLRFVERRLNAPLDRKKPTTYFVNSMGDLFHEDVPDEWIIDVLTVMAITHRHTYQVLTKRAERMREFMSRPGLLEEIYANWYTFSDGAREVQAWPLPNLWLGVSTERQQEADERIPLLLQTPAAVRFISAEPLLGPIDLTRMGIGGRGVNALGFYTNAMTGHAQHQIPALDWVIVGGESGHDARPMHPDWARSLRDQCKAASVPFFFKQWGEWGPSTPEQAKGNPRSGWCVHPEARAAFIEHFGKKAAGRLLDGAEHNATPVRP